MTDQHIILYPYGLCNLRCSYCFIDKNKGLTEIDNLLKICEALETDIKNII